jgi:hypothetical protein
MSLHWIIRAITGCVILALVVGLIVERRAHLSSVRELAALQAKYEQAAKDSQELQRMNVVAVQSEQSGITENVEEINATKLAALRSDNNRLGALVERLQSQADRGSPGASGASEVPDAARLADGSHVLVPADALLRAQEIELSRNALIDWVQRQAEVDYNVP